MEYYEIAEIFYSIQGEGYFSGTPAVFIRFTGCNLNCVFCDEPLHKMPGKKFSAQEIWEQIQSYPSNHMVLTGGEPTLVENLALLIRYLKSKRSYFVQMETNGTRSIDRNLVDWITVSPKTKDFITGDELKLPYQGDISLSNISYSGFNHYYLHPINCGEGLDRELNLRAVEEVKMNPGWRLSVQLHKALHIL